MSHEITIKGGKSKKLLTGGKFCKHDIIVHAQGEINLQSNKTIAPTTARQTILPDSGYDAMDKVTVEAMPQANLAAPSISVSSGGLITARSTQTTSGYVASGATAQATSQLLTQSADTITPSKSSQTAVAANRYTTGAVLVNPIPDSYVQPTGTLTITENGQHDVKTRAYVNVSVASSGGSDESFKTVIEGASGLVTLPSNLTKIRDYAFYYNTNLSLVSLPSGITSIGTSSFHYCSLLSFTSLPLGITKLGNNAFRECTRLALTSLPPGLTSIGNCAFYNCQKLALTSLPAGLTSIGSETFYYCPMLALTSIPASVTSIASNAFYYCTGLTRITFEGKPSSISSSAFNGCSNLRTINVPWAEGEVSGAPWSATSATINYNYTGG